MFLKSTNVKSKVDYGIEKTGRLHGRRVPAVGSKIRLSISKKPSISFVTNTVFGGGTRNFLVSNLDIIIIFFII